MHDGEKAARLLIESATIMARAISARAILVAVDALPEVTAVPPKTILIARDETDAAAAEKLATSADACITVPEVELNRIGQVRLAAIIGLSNRVIELSDSAVFLAGPYKSMIDSMIVMSLGSEYEVFDSSDQPAIDEHIRRAVFHRVLSFALKLGQHGREGRKVGGLLVVGDSQTVLDQSDQLILNPFMGYSESLRNVLDDRMTETMREYSALDGAIVIRGSGVVETAGAHLNVGVGKKIPPGLGARHAAAAGITATTRAIAITVSESDGAVRVWRLGKLVATFEPSMN